MPPIFIFADYDTPAYAFRWYWYFHWFWLIWYFAADFITLIIFALFSIRFRQIFSDFDAD
jgi:hypothetical protein